MCSKQQIPAIVLMSLIDCHVLETMQGIWGLWRQFLTVAY